jgi:hypothetical protein
MVLMAQKERVIPRAKAWSAIAEMERELPG